MVEIEKIRAEFSKRLHHACALANVRDRGRAVDIQAELKKRGIKTSTTAIGKWLNGESIPEPDKLLPLADWLKVPPEWLEYGRGLEPSPETVLTSGGYRISKNVADSPTSTPGNFFTVSIGNGRTFFVESEKDADFLKAMAKDIPLTMRIRNAKEALLPLPSEEAMDLTRSIVGVHSHPREVLFLVDSLLEAAAYNAIDLDEIKAITTLVQKRRNEKVHGKDVVRGSRKPPES